MVGCSELALYTCCSARERCCPGDIPCCPVCHRARYRNLRSSPGRRRSGGRRRDRGRASPPAVADRADRQREHRLARGARGARLGPDEQICRGLSRTALLRRLRVRRCRRASGDRAREAPVRLRLRQCAAACRGAGQPGGVSGAAEARRHGSRHVARRRRASDARRRAEPVGQVVSRGPLRRARRGRADRFRRRSSAWPRSTGRG